MAQVHDAAAYILHARGPMSAMKLQKLCYYAYGYHLAWETRQLFPERFEAWANGPVCPDLYARHRGQFTLGGPAAPQEDVAGLKIAVDNALAMSVVQTVGNLNGIFQSCSQRQPSPGQTGFQRFSVDEFHYQEMCSVLLANVMQRADTRMVQAADDLRLAFKALEPLRIGGQLFWKNLYCDFAVQAGVRRTIHFAHTTGTEQAANNIRT